MATITVRGVDDHVRDRLRERAAAHGRSMEAEARAVLAASVMDVTWWDRLVEAGATLTADGPELEQPPRDGVRPVDLA